MSHATTQVCCRRVAPQCHDGGFESAGRNGYRDSNCGRARRIVWPGTLAPPADNAIYKIPQASSASKPVNADPEHPSEIVEFTKFGQFVREYNVDAGQGGAFGLDAVSDSDGGFNYAAIDDVTNSLSVYRLSSH